jgi:hypothetical protein
MSEQLVLPAQARGIEATLSDERTREEQVDP